MLKIVSVLCAVFVVSATGKEVKDVVKDSCEAHLAAYKAVDNDLTAYLTNFTTLNEWVEKTKAHEKLMTMFKQNVTTLSKSIVALNTTKYSECVDSGHELFASLKTSSQGIIENTIVQKSGAEDPVEGVKKGKVDAFKTANRDPKCDAIPISDDDAAEQTFRDHGTKMVEAVKARSNGLLAMTKAHIAITDLTDFLDITNLNNVTIEFASTMTKEKGKIETCMLLITSSTM